MGMFIVALAGQIHPAVLGLISEEFQRNFAQRGLLLGVAPAGFLVTTLLTGWLSDRWGQRPFIWAGFALIAVGMVLVGATRYYLQLQVGLLIIGISGGLLEAPLSALSADAFPKRRAQVLNATQIFFNIGAVIGPAAAGVFLWLGYSWRGGFGLGAALALAVLGFSVWALPKRGGRRCEQHAGEAGERIPWGLVAVIALVLFLYVGGEMTFAGWCANYLYETFEVSKERASMVVAGFWLGMMLGRAVYVLIIRFMGHFIPLLLSVALAIAAGLGILWAGSATVAAILYILVGFFFGGMWPTILAYAAHRVPQRTGTVFGVVVAVGAGGMLVFPPLAGWFAQRLHYGLKPVIVVGAGAVFLEGLLVAGLWVQDKRHRAAIRAG